MRIGRNKPPKVDLPKPNANKPSGGKKGHGVSGNSGGIADAAKKLDRNQNSTVTQLMKKSTGATGAAGLSAPDLGKVKKVGKEIGEVADTGQKLVDQVQGIKTTVEDYVTEIVDTAKGPIESMQAKIDELQNRETVGDKVKEHVREEIDAATAPKPAVVEPEPTPMDRLQNASDFAKSEAKWAGGLAAETAEQLKNDGQWLAGWSKDTLDATKHMAKLIGEAPDVTRDVIDQTKDAVDTAEQLYRQVDQLQKDLEDLSSDTGASEYIPNSGELAV